MALTMYDVSDVASELAKLTGKRTPYSRARVDILIKHKLPTAQILGNQYYLTEKELAWLGEQIQVRRRPKKY